MSTKKKIFIAVVLLLIGTSIWFYNRIIYDAPVENVSTVNVGEVNQISSTHFTLGNSWLRLNEYGNWECYIEGNGFERGLTLGKLQKKLSQDQEAVFVAEIDKNVPSWWFRKFLTLGISWFNRDLDQFIPKEYRDEIYGISLYFSDKYDFIGPKYNRIINYHAAHDIGHAVQNMHLVGCTAFGTWRFDSTHQEMIMGRAFDFYFGDDFAKNKIILMSNPDSGYKNISVTWAGFTGVVSGMNEMGLGITLNSDKSEIPSESGTPVSLIARDVLQYASNIKEAIAICNKYTSFVSESFTISSAKDQTVIVLEKTPTQTGIYYPNSDTVIVTNHYLSPELKNLPLNVEHMKTSESVRRFNRAAQLVSESDTMNYFRVANILRDQKGVNGTDIGLGNPLAINQLLAHHAVIFKNVKKLVWVSAYPFQENVLQAYDLNDFDTWNSNTVTFPITVDSLLIPEDAFYNSPKFGQFETFKSEKENIKMATGNLSEISSTEMGEFVATNPNYYETYRLIGNYYFAKKQFKKAVEFYKKALTKEIAYGEDKDFIINRIKECELHD